MLFETSIGTVLLGWRNYVIKMGFMENEKENHKIFLACNRAGMAEEIVLDTDSLFENIELPVDLKKLFSPSSIEKLENFLHSIWENSMDKDTVLTLSLKDNSIDCMFSGFLVKDTALLFGSTVLTSSEGALEEVMLINNEQANQIRLSEKKVDASRKEVEQKILDEAFLNDFTSINNELINSQRELVRKNQKIELLNTELKVANENMSMFTYSVSHDLKEPVRMIRSFLFLIHKNYRERLDQKGQGFIDMALDGAERLNRMMVDLLEYHQSDNLSTTESVDLNEVFLEVKQILQNEIEEKDARVTSENLPTLKGSTTGYLQVFQNLISNAIKFVPEERTPIVSILVKESNTHYTFMVKDNGIGIAEDKIHGVFDLFKRLHSQKQYRGTGVGLAMVKKSIERMGGEVWVESEVGKGSTFCFSIAKSPES